jgi:hypothetical protein
MLLTRQTIPGVFSGTNLNANYTELETSFADLGPYVISGLTFAAGTGLSVNVAAGSASIGGDVAVGAGFTIAGLANGAVNDIYLLWTGAGTSLTHPSTPPANSVLLGTATTAGGVVTAVNMGRSSGRQRFVQPQNLVPGGPSAGTPSAGHPATLNLANWNAAPGEGVAFTGALPAGSLPADVAYVDVANTFTQTQTITAPAAGRCLTLNSDTGATIFMNPKSGTQRSAIRWGADFQFLSDTGNSNVADFGVQNLTSGNLVLQISTTDLVTVGSANAAGGAVLGKSGGKIAAFDGTPAVQQATASTAGIAGIRTDTIAHAVADIQTILTALRAWGVAYNLTANTA